MTGTSFFKLPAILLCLVCFLTACSEDPPSPGEGPNPPDPVNPPFSHIYARGEKGYFCFRIPAIVKTTKGTVLAFAEGRRFDCSDEREIDLVVKRSYDNGLTWSELSVIWHDPGNTCGNPAPVVDQNTGTIHLLMTWNLGEDRIGAINDGTSRDTRRAFYTNSIDDGVTWAEPREITSDVKKPEWGWYATGPCHGIQLTKGEHAGRLVIPCTSIDLRRHGGRGHSHLIYSDDAGATWKLGGVTPTHSTINPNESSVAELSDGRLLVNSRSGSANNRRVISHSSDGGLTLSPVSPVYALIDPVCQGSLLSADINGVWTLFFSNAASLRRENMTLRMSVNDGVTWTRTLTVYPGPSAYSDLVMLSDTQIGIFWEAGNTSPYEGIAFKIINIADFR